MRPFPPQWLKATIRLALLCATVFVCASAAFAQAQSNAADLRGFVRDPQGAVVANATVTVRNPATNVARTTTTNSDGFYQVVNLPPGDYEVAVEAANYKRAVAPAVTLTVGQQADLDITLEVGEVTATVTISDATTEVVETSRTAVATTIDQQRIDNLPINERNYLSFALTTSTVTRDNGRPIGPAPTTGLNFGGQRGRSNLVQVDGADNTDNSVNAARSTVSQEAVQEFQVVTNSYAPEFGRSAGGVVNVVTKSGTNDIRGNVFGFLRHRSFQARNPFAPIADPPFTRAQYGATVGGPLDKDRTFFFFAFEQRRRNESGFFTSDVRGTGLQRLDSQVTINALPAGLPGGVSNLFPFPVTFTNITARQAAFVNGLVTQALGLLGNPATFTQGVQAFGGAVTYAYLASSGGSTGLTGTNPLAVAPIISRTVSATGITPLAPGQVVGGRFLFSSAPVPVGTTNSQGQPIAFRPLLNLQRVFPVTERTTFSSIRVDHRIDDQNLLTLRFGYNPSDITGIQVESQNQSLGQNDVSRTGEQGLRDYSFVTSLNSTLSNTMVNEARFNFGERRATFRSQNGDAVASNLPGIAFIGRELFSPVVRTETRYQFTDSLNLVAGNHTFKFGGDVNFVSIPSAIFELNFAGLFFFGNTTITSVPGSPDLTPAQSYGLGLPSTFIQGFGNPVSKLNNKPLAFFVQDSWKIKQNLTLNYGVRYDVELTQQIPPVEVFTDPLSGISLSRTDLLAAQDAVGVQQGFPRDKNNFAPRIAVAWDPHNDGKTVIRAAFGLFYDHPLLAVGFNSDIADAAQQQQATFVGSSDVSPTALINASQIFQGTVCTQASLSAFCQGFIAANGLPANFQTPGVARSAQYQFGRQRFNDQTFPGFGQILPFTLPVSKTFEYAYANQANLTIERQLSKDMSFSASYLFVGAHHLPHPQDINVPRQDLLAENFRRFANRLPGSFSEAVASVTIPATNASGVPLAPGTLFTNAFGQQFIIIVPGLIAAQAANPTVRVISPAAANLFRPNAPNYFLVQALTGLTPAAFNTLLGGTLRTPGVVSPFGDVSAQVSDGNSNYNAMSLELKKRFSHNFQFLASYTWSHSIDDSSDLQTLLKPQDNRNLRLERADSLFDQRHRFVFSGVLASPGAWRSGSGWQRAFADFILAPIVEISSGRPFNILSSVDTNFDQQSSNDRPSVAADGTLCVAGTPNTPCASIVLPANGSLGRNMGITHSYASLDMRLTRTVRLGERLKLDIIAEGFNLFNRFNEAAASPFFEDVNAFGQRKDNGRYYSRPTASFDPRQFQFGLKLNF
jgi:hypothetical protein